MGWVPDEYADGFWLAVAPIMTAPTLVYGATGLVTGDYPLGKPDWRANVRNTLLWGGVAASVYGWNYFVSPHNATWLSGGEAFSTAAQIFTSSSWAAPAAGAAALAAVPTALYVANKAVIESAPEEQQQSLWQVFAQALTGTGPGTGGYEFE